MVSSGDGPVGASKLTEEVGAKEGTFDNSVLVVCSWLRCLTVSISSSCVRGPRAEKKMCQIVSIIFFSDAVHHGKPANYGKRHDRSGHQAENNCIRLKLPTISSEGTPDNNFLFGGLEITLSIQ